MHSVQNFFLSARKDPSSLLEKVSDYHLLPARILFGGRVVVESKHAPTLAVDQTAFLSSQIPWKIVALKVIAIVALPLAVVGTLMKAICLINPDYRRFSLQKISQNIDPNSKLFEMFQHVYATARFIAPSSEDSGKLHFKPLNLYECSCGSTGAFHRLKRPRRNELEKAFLERLTTVCPDRTNEVRLLSLGSGGLMADFITLERLILAGYKNIEIDCVDPEGIELAKVESIRDFFKQFPEVSVAINGYRYVSDIQTKEQYHAILAVDFDGIPSSPSCLLDLMKAQQKLTAKGFLTLGFFDIDMFLNAKGEPVFLNPPSPTQKLILDLPLHFSKSKSSLSIALPKHDFVGSLISLYSVALALKKSQMTYSTIEITCIDSKDLENYPKQKETFTNLLKQLFPDSSVTLSNHQADKKYDFFFTARFEEEFTTRKYLEYLDKESLTYILAEDKTFSKQSGKQPVTYPLLTTIKS